MLSMKSTVTKQKSPLCFLSCQLKWQYSDFEIVVLEKENLVHGSNFERLKTPSVVILTSEPLNQLKSENTSRARSAQAELLNDQLKFVRSVGYLCDFVGR